VGQKVCPIGLRLGINKESSSRWYSEPKEYAKILHEDLAIRKFVANLPDFKMADISEVEIVRHPQKTTVIIHTAKPGVLIGQKGANIEAIGLELQKLTTKKVMLKIKEVKRPEVNAQIIAQSICRQLENRGSHRRAMKMAISTAIKNGALGCRIRMSGRLAGADMSRTEDMREGRVPLHTLRADIDYGFHEAQTTYGKIGVRVWICKNENVFAADRRDDAGLLVTKQRRDGSSASSEQGEEKKDAGRGRRPAAGAKPRTPRTPREPRS
jgi:small subunit ribosomal protein S3